MGIKEIERKWRDMFNHSRRLIGISGELQLVVGFLSKADKEWVEKMYAEGNINQLKEFLERKRAND